MIEADIKKIAILFIDQPTNSQWSMTFEVGVDNRLVCLGDYIRAATSNPFLQDMRNVGLTEVREDQHDGVSHGTIINRWI